MHKKIHFAPTGVQTICADSGSATQRGTHLAPPPLAHIRTTARDWANPVDYQHFYASMARFAEHLALQYDANRTRHSYYCQLRLIHQRAGQFLPQIARFQANAPVPRQPQSPSGTSKIGAACSNAVITNCCSSFSLDTSGLFNNGRICRLRTLFAGSAHPLAPCHFRAPGQRAPPQFTLQRSSVSRTCPYSKSSLDVIRSFV